MEHGGLGEIFKDEQYFICEEDDEFISKGIDIIDDKVNFKFENIINKYTDEKVWKKKFEKIYDLKK